MKAVLVLLVLFAVAAFVPVGGSPLWVHARDRGLPREAALLTARGLRATWDFVAGIGQQTAATHAPPAHSPKQASRNPPAQHRIVPQPPKERLQPSDRAALNHLVAGSR
jgi:hypothetical protein